MGLAGNHTEAKQSPAQKAWFPDGWFLFFYFLFLFFKVHHVKCVYGALM